MKMLFSLSIVVLLALTPWQCLALSRIGVISTNEAKEMGLKIRTTPAGPDAVAPELDFKTEGKLKNYSPDERCLSHVELEIAREKRCW